MVSLKLATLAVAALRVFSAVAELPAGIKVEEVEELADGLGDESKLQSPNLAVEISASFPQAEVFGVKLVNGRATRAVLDVSNNEPLPITVVVVGGSLLSPLDTPGAPNPPVILRNLTAQRYGVKIPAGEKESLTYSFATEMHPQDLRLNIAAVLQNSEGNVFSIPVYNETVSVVEGPMSIFDPQMYVSLRSKQRYIETDTHVQHLPLPVPRSRIRRCMLLHLRKRGRFLLPTKAPRRQGRGAREEVIRRHQESRPC